MYKPQTNNQETQYFDDFYGLLKEVAQHEFYMQKNRIQLCQNNQFDYDFAFKYLDIFHHNKVIPEEIYSRFKQSKYEISIQQCNELVKTLNKSQLYFTNESFQQFILCQDVSTRNTCLSRYKNFQIGIGSYSLICSVKENSQQLVRNFLIKQITFIRQLLHKKQQFITKHSGDIYTAIQHIFKGKKQSVNFKQFANAAYQHRIVFNSGEFFAIWKRSKKVNADFTVYHQDVKLDRKQIAELVLCKNLSLKQKFGMEMNVSVNEIYNRRPSSYQEPMHIKRQKYQLKKTNPIEQYIQLVKASTKKQLKYPFAIPQQQYRPLPNQYSLRVKQQQWLQDVIKMDDDQLRTRYYRAINK